MLSKKQRLRTKDVLFLTKKRQFYGNGLFWFFYIQQYPNLKYHQISCHITIKYSKHSADRNLLKRAIMMSIQWDGKIKNPWWQYYYKVFIILNKNKLDQLQKDVANQDRKHIISHIQRQFSQSFTALSTHLWASSKTSSTTVTDSSKDLAKKTNSN